jgi:phosphomannomutase/phosphoglucomutase
LIAKDILGGWERIFKKEKRFVCDVRSLLGFRTAVERLGGKVEMIPAGRSFFRQELFENPDILLGVEASGHIHISDNFYGFDDGIFAAARLLQILSKSRKPLSKLVSEFPLSFHTPEIKIPCPDEKKFALVEKVKQNFAQKYDTIEVDGVRAKLDEKSWFLVRAKNTGPYLSLRFEADTKEKVLEMVRVVAKELEKFTEIDDSWRDEIEVVG